jgi:hypothetical protein
LRKRKNRPKKRKRKKRRQLKEKWKKHLRPVIKNSFTDFIYAAKTITPGGRAGKPG